MGKRLTRIYTRTGDEGSTGLADGSRVDKMGPRITAIGDIDELNSHLGLVLTRLSASAEETLLRGIQHDLFDLGGELAIPGSRVISAKRVARLETAIDGYNHSLGPLEEFILPGGGQAGATTHVARTVCRRAERALIALSRQEGVNPRSLAYLNRLSDLLFVLARHFNHADGVDENYWKKHTGTENGDKSG